MIFGARAPSPAEVAAAQSSNVCPPPAETSAGGTSVFSAVGVLSGGRGTGPGEIQVEGVPRSSRGRLGDDEAGSSPSGVLGTRFTKAADTVKELHPLLFFLLGVAVALLGIAALPARAAPNARFARLLAYRRGTIALAGATTLVVAMVFYVLS